jgi:putative phosphoesterase
MRIALFSDIHANLPAFEAFLVDLDSRMPDAIYCMGDLVGYNVWPNEIIDEIRKRGIPTLAGNHDLKVRHLKPTSDLSASGKEYAYHIIADEGRNYLLTLPAHIRWEFQLNEKFNILLVHGSPRKVDEYVLEDSDEDFVLKLMQEANADMLCVGHSHKPYYRVINSETGLKHVINTGSVGKPKDGNPKGGYVILTLNENSSVNDPSSIQVEFIRFEYDVQKAAEVIIDSPLPDEFADQLIKAY